MKTALKKHADDDQFFCSLNDYVLCYPDQKLVQFIPGISESFIVEKYKEEFLSKPYSKMDLFLCNISVYGKYSNMKNSKSNGSSNQNEKKVENNILDKNSHLFEPEIPNSHGLSSPEDLLSNSSTTCLPNFKEPWFPGSSSSACLPTQQELLIDLPSISIIIDNTTSADSTPSKDVQQHQQTDNHKVFCPVCNQQFSVSFIEEHANECLERRCRQLFSKGVIEINSDSESEQYNSDNHQTSGDKENEPIIQENLDALTRKIQAVTGSCKMEKETVLQLNIRRGYCFQDFTKAFRQNWNFKKNNQYVVSFVGEAEIDHCGVSREFYSGLFKFGLLNVL